MGRLLALLALLGSAIVAVRRDLIVRAIRAGDRRAGVFSTHGAAWYARGSRLVRGLHRRVAAEAAATIGMRKAAVVVDIGSGPGDLLAELRALAPEAQLTGVEPSEEMRAIAAQRGVVALEGRAEALPLPDASVDLVLSTLSSHHWEDARAAFAEIKRVLRPEGEARIYDFRFAGYGRDEALTLADDAGIPRDRVAREVLDERLLGFRPYAVITVHR